MEIASNKYPSGTYYIVLDIDIDIDKKIISLKALNSIDARVKKVMQLV